MRKLALPLVAACAVFAISAPATMAKDSTNVRQYKKIGKINGALKGVQKAISQLRDTDTGHVAAINQNISDLAALKATVEAVTAAATKALTDINSALTNSTTGLVGLNLARPQFGAFDAAGVIQGGTGQVSGASGPKANAVKGSLGGGTLTALYVVDFGNDVSKRMYSVNMFPTSPGVAAPGTPQAVNCASTTDTAALCGAIQGVASDNSPNKVAVKFGTGSTASEPVSGFSVTAISG